jgi:hypothetical protein
MCAGLGTGTLISGNMLTDSSTMGIDALILNLFVGNMSLLVCSILTYSLTMGNDDTVCLQHSFCTLK